MVEFNPHQQKVFDLCKAQKAGAPVYIVGPRRSGLSTIARELAAARPTWCVHDYNYGEFDPVTQKCPRTVTKYNETPAPPLGEVEGTFIFFTPDGSGSIVIPNSHTRHNIGSEAIGPPARFVVYIAK